MTTFRLSSWTCAAAALSLCQGLAAQTNPGEVTPAQAHPLIAQVMTQVFGDAANLGWPHELMQLASQHMGSGRVVKGAPYCAEAVSENVQWLVDGSSSGTPNRIVRRQSTQLCRDGEGRTRQEVDVGGRKVVYLNDAATGERWVLDPQRKTARSIKAMALPTIPGAAPLPPLPPLPPLAQAADGHNGGPVQVMVMTTPDAANGAAPHATTSAPTPASGAAKRETRHVQVRVIRPEGDMARTMPPPEVSWRAHQFAPRGPGVANALGQKDIEGQRANGERTTWTIEAGKLGNERPIVITREVWTAPELMLTVLSRDLDPRSGEAHYKLQNIKRGEPDAALMRVPADYNSTPRTPATPGKTERG